MAHTGGPQEKQQLRDSRLVQSVVASAVTVGIALMAAQSGYMSLGAALTYGAAVAVLCVLFLGLFISGLNRKFSDPSLTVPQLVAAGLAISYAAYHGGEARAAFMAMYLMAFTFAVFTLHLRGLVAVAVFYLACYATVAALSLRWHPEQADANRELFRIVALGVVLAWMIYMGSYVATLRQSLRQTERQLRDELERSEVLAQRDGLTGAFNRRHMMSLLAVEVTRAQRGSALSLCLADIDHFKAINDSHGHQAGDAVLKRFCSMVQAQLRPTDMLARFGGEEFLVVLSHTALDEAAQVAERVRAQVAAESFAGLPGEQRVTVSIGFAQHRPGDPVETTLQRADTALYEAKRQGRDRVVSAG